MEKSYSKRVWNGKGFRAELKFIAGSNRDEWQNYSWDLIILIKGNAIISFRTGTRYLPKEYKNEFIELVGFALDNKIIDPLLDRISEISINPQDTIIGEMCKTLSGLIKKKSNDLQAM